MLKELVCVGLLIICMPEITAQSAENEPVPQEQAMAPYEFEVTEEILHLIEDEEIPVPEVKPPSKLMEFLRTFGIAVLTRYYALKGWVLKTWRGKGSDEAV